MKETAKNNKLNIRDDLSFYIKSIKKYPILSRDDELVVAIKAKSGDKDAMKKLVQSNLLLVVKIAKQYSNIFTSINELIQEGSVGLLRAVEKFDPSRGFRFTTFAAWWCKSMILRYIFNNSHMIKPGTTNEQKKLFYNLRKEQRRLEALGIVPDPITVAKNLEVSIDNVIEMDGRLRSDIYLDATFTQEEAGNEDNEKSYYEYLASDKEQQADNLLEKYNFNHIISEKLKNFGITLKGKDKDIFYNRLMTDAPETLQAIGDRAGLSKERIRQCEEALLLRLRKYLKEYNTKLY